MCGRYSLAADGHALQQRFGLSERAAARPPRFNITPGEQVLALLAEQGEPREAELLWGFVPHWAKGPAIGRRMINARSETVASKPAFAGALVRRRCILPADGFYEWQPRAGMRKLPFHITVGNGGPFALAGIWSLWRDPATERTLASCAILTRPAGRVVAPIHDRQPVILAGADAERAWLDLSSPEGVIRELAGGAPLAPLHARPVGTAVNDPRHDGPECLDPPEDEPGSLF